MKTFLSLFLFLFRLSGSAQEVKIYLSPTGNDSWTGTIEKPYATLQKARDVIRTMKAGGKFNKPVTVLLHGGYYELPETFVLKPEDSGTEQYPITYMAYPGEKPVISGGKKITSGWKVYQDKIMVCSLPAQIAGKVNFRQLFVDGERQVRARTPDDSYYKIDKKTEDLNNSQIRFREGDNKTWRNIKNSEVVLLNMTDESRLFISNVSLPGRLINFTGPRGGQTLGRGNSSYFLFLNRYYLENALDFLNRPKEWFLDFPAGKLYYWPASSIEKSEIRIPVLKQLVRLEGQMKVKKYVQYITFSGLTFSDSEWSIPKQGYPAFGDVGDIVLPSAITFDGTSYCVFKNNKIKNTGTYALEVTGFANQITDNEISNTGGGGIITRNYEKIPNTISFNLIYNCGQVFPAAVGIHVDDGGGIISHNLIHDISHSGIYTRHKATLNQKVERRNQTQALLIEYNEIFKVMQKLNDGAGIFVQDSNIIIRNNLVYDIVAPAGGAPGRGISLGTGTRNALVENNLVKGTMEGLHIGSANRNNRVVNNIFVSSEEAMVKLNNETNRRNENVRITKNIFYFGNSDADIYNSSGDNSLPAEADNNVFWNPYRCLLLSPAIRGVHDVDYIADWQKKGFDKHSLVIDPKFVDEKNNNYDLKRGSPAFKVGFKSIDISNVGIKGHSK